MPEIIIFKTLTYRFILLRLIDFLNVSNLILIGYKKETQKTKIANMAEKRHETV